MESFSFPRKLVIEVTASLSIQLLGNVRRIAPTTLCTALLWDSPTLLWDSPKEYSHGCGHGCSPPQKNDAQNYCTPVLYNGVLHGTVPVEQPPT